VATKVTIEQGGEVLLEYVMGRRTNLKIWPFSSGGFEAGWTGGCGAVEGSWRGGLVTECHWPYGANENIVWEGYNTTQPVSLKAGKPAVVTLTTVADCPACHYGDRNIDVIMFHPLAADIEQRLHTAPEDTYLPLDGLFSACAAAASACHAFALASIVQALRVDCCSLRTCSLQVMTRVVSFCVSALRTMQASTTKSSSRFRTSETPRCS
jgi:hypothetical protein